MPESHVNDLKRWRNNADEMRALAEGVKDAATRRIMNRLANGWDKLAYRAERRAAQQVSLRVAIFFEHPQTAFIAEVCALN
jgi:hypothetical protein